MRATDVSPSRVEAAISAAKSFVDDLPRQVRVGLVSFDRTPRLVSSPTVDHDAVLEGLDSLMLGPGTAGGDALYAALDALNASYGGRPSSAKEDGAAIVLLSDGVTTVGSSVHAAAEHAAEQGIPVSTIAFGTDAGSVFVEGRRVAVPADPDTMQDVADITGGKAFEAASGDELRSVYEDIGTRVSFESMERDASGGYLTLAAVALAAGFGLAMLWNGRLV
jgi:Ca-activated chloride channel family protein